VIKLSDICFLRHFQCNIGERVLRSVEVLVQKKSVYGRSRRPMV